LTVTVICCRLLGVEKPAGVERLIAVVPAACGSNAAVLSNETLLVKTNGLPTIVPAAGLELVIVTDADKPPRMAWVPA
jgi:hypothetical protein